MRAERMEAYEEFPRGAKLLDNERHVLDESALGHPVDVHVVPNKTRVHAQVRRERLHVRLLHPFPDQRLLLRYWASFARPLRTDILNVPLERL